MNNYSCDIENLNNFRDIIIDFIKYYFHYRIFKKFNSIE